jgi:hypothetical protein
MIDKSNDNEHDYGTKATQKRLQALLYLRGNHLRLLLNRHQVMSTTNIHADIPAAQRLVDLATDSIHVLVRLRLGSDVYLRQQVAFNYFLVNALATIFLAVCHEPSMFASQCKESFYSAVEVIRVFSSRSHVSKRLWRSIKGLLPQAQRLGLDQDDTVAKRPSSGTHRAGAQRVAENAVSNRSIVHGAAQDDEIVVARSQPAGATQPSPMFAANSNSDNNSVSQALQSLPSDHSPSTLTSSIDVEQITTDMVDWYGMLETWNPDDNSQLASTMTNVRGIYEAEVELSGLFNEFMSA